MTRWLVISCLLLATNAFADDHTIPSVTDKPWSASMAYGGGVLRSRSDDPDLLGAAAIEFAIRRRVRSDIEIALGLGGLVARDYGYAGFYADVRYRLLAERPWDPFGFGSVGIAGFGNAGGPTLLLRAGFGIERRFVSWGFAGDVYLARANGDDTVVVRGKGTEQAHFGVLGAGLSISATYYWGRSRSRRRFVP